MNRIHRHKWYVLYESLNGYEIKSGRELLKLAANLRNNGLDWRDMLRGFNEYQDFDSAKKYLLKALRADRDELTIEVAIVRRLRDNS